MLQTFSELVERARVLGRVTISVAAAQDEEVLSAVKQAQELGLADAILIGDAVAIRPMLARAGLPADTRIVDEPDIDKAALAAVDLVHRGEAQLLMKGLINSSNFLRAVLNAEHGLKCGKQLSHLAAFEIPGVKKLNFHTDGGMNVAPGQEEKKKILENALEALAAIGIAKPNVVALAANEQVNPKIPATTDARALMDAAGADELPPCVLEGPVAMDVAASAEAAKHKGIHSAIAGDVDLFLMPDIQVGNIVGKTLVHFANAKNAGVILGATHPVVLTSRSDSAETKVHSIALACLIAQGGCI